MWQVQRLGIDRQDCSVMNKAVLSLESHDIELFECRWTRNSDFETIGWTAAVTVPDYSSLVTATLAETGRHEWRMVWLTIHSPSNAASLVECFRCGAGNGTTVVCCLRWTWRETSGLYIRDQMMLRPCRFGHETLSKQQQCRVSNLPVEQSWT